MLLWAALIKCSISGPQILMCIESLFLIVQICYFIQFTSLVTDHSDESVHKWFIWDILKEKTERDGGTFPESWVPEGELALFTLSLNNCCSINKLHCIGSFSCQRERRIQQLNSCLWSCRCSFLSCKMEIWAESGAVVVLGRVTELLKTKRWIKWILYCNICLIATGKQDWKHQHDVTLSPHNSLTQSLTGDIQNQAKPSCLPL